MDWGSGLLFARNRIAKNGIENKVTKVALRLSVLIWTLLDLFQSAQTFDSRSVTLFLSGALIFPSLQLFSTQNEIPG
jgi:hypothetical protein